MGEGLFARNPSARLLDPADDDNPDAVALSATGEADILGVVGPYVLYTHRSTIESSDMERADTARGILDVRLAKTVPITAIVGDTASISGGGIRERNFMRWRHSGYDVLARFDSTRRQSEMMLRDARHRVWKLGYVNSRVPRIFWLDGPRVDARIRTAITRAFEGALSDDETSQLAHSPGGSISPVARLQ